MCWSKSRSPPVSKMPMRSSHSRPTPAGCSPSATRNVSARAFAQHGLLADEVNASVTFSNGTAAHLETSRISELRRRGMRAEYRDGVIEIDFITRKVRNTTPRPLKALEMGDPLAESVAAFVLSVRHGAPPLVRPQEARRALQTALLIEIGRAHV